MGNLFKTSIVIVLIHLPPSISLAQDEVNSFERRVKNFNANLTLTVEGLSEELTSKFMQKKIRLAEFIISASDFDEYSPMKVKVIYSKGRGDIILFVPTYKIRLPWEKINLPYKQPYTAIQITAILFLVSALRNFADVVAPTTKYWEEINKFEYAVVLNRLDKESRIAFLAYRKYSGGVSMRNYAVYFDENNSPQPFEDITEDHNDQIFHLGDATGIDGKPTIYIKVMEFLGIK